MRDELDVLCDEAHKNAKLDRSTLRAHMKKLKGSIGDDPDRILLASDAIAKTSDALSKANAQIIQIAQIKQKSKMPTKSFSDDGFNDSETENIYEEIKHPEEKQN